MEVSIKIESWKITTDADGERKVAGVYTLWAGSMKMATQEFNEGYSAVKIPFSGELIRKALEVEAAIKSEVTTLLN